MADTTKFDEIVGIVIDNFEGGYFHPHMIVDGSVKDPYNLYKNSGETMFGLDRKTGGSLNTSQSGIAFWNLIDGANASTTWHYNYNGGSLAPQLKKYIANIFYPTYNLLANKYLTPVTRSIVESDKRLLFHFAYGVWNGAGWFQKFANDMNKSVASGITNPDDLVQVALNSRTKEGLTKDKPPSKQNIKAAATMVKLFTKMTGINELISDTKKKNN